MFYEKDSTERFLLHYKISRWKNSFTIRRNHICYIYIYEYLVWNICLYQDDDRIYTNEYMCTIFVISQYVRPVCMYTRWGRWWFIKKDTIPWWCHDMDTPDSKVHGANMGPIWGRQDPGGPHVGPMNFAIWDHFRITCSLSASSNT